MKKLRKGRVVIALFILILILSGSLILFKELFVNESDNPIKLSKNNESEEKLSLLIAGNVLLDRDINRDAIVELNKYDFDYIFEDFRSNFEGFDLKIYNQNSIIGGKDLGLSSSPRYNSPEEIGNTMVDLGFNVVSLANFNSFDKGEKGVINSINFWDKKDVLYSGNNIEENSEILIKEKKDMKYTMISYTTKLKYNLTKKHLVNVYSEEKVKQDIKKIKGKTDLILVSIFWEENIIEQQKIAKYLSSLGVDIIIGNNGKTIQPIEIIDNTLVIYSNGNFLSNESDVEKATGMLVSLDVNFNEKKKIFNNINAKLVYTFSDNGNNFKVVPYEKLNEQQLPNKTDLYKIFSDEIRTLYKTITISKVGE